MKKREVIKAKVAKRNPAQNVTQKDSNLFVHELEKKIPSVHTIELSTVYLLNGYLISLEEYKMYNSYTHTYPISKKRMLLTIGKVILSNLLSKTKKIENAIFATDNWSDGYFHWFTDVVPRILVAQNSIKYKDKTELLISKALEKYDFISLTGLKLNQKIRFYEDNQVYKIKKITLSSHIGNSGNYDKGLMNRARELFTEKDDSYTNNQDRNRKIYISRQKARYRKINNEQEVQQLLKKYGYEVHYFEDYTFENQIQLLKKTTSLVSLHGAGLTNILFMNPKTRVLEIRNEEDKHNNCYFSLASDLDIDYYYLLSKGDSSDTHTVNIDVDIESLEQIILSMERSI